MESTSNDVPTSIDSLIFPIASQNFSQTLSAFKRSRLSIRHRISSILEDSAFVCEVSADYGLPLVANERCGSWYIPPWNKKGSVYFKSTDGHHGQWKFSMRRINLQLLEIAEKNHGLARGLLRFDLANELYSAVLVDSTRRGKTMPDALSKTVPIWCAVMNRFLFPQSNTSHRLHTPPNVVSKSEHTQIENVLGRHLLDLQVCSSFQ